MPGVVRLADFCSGHTNAIPRPCTSASNDVFANGIGVNRQGDTWLPHGHPVHGGITAGGSSTVFANGLPVARIGDAINCGSTCAQGSEDVFAG